MIKIIMIVYFLFCSELIKAQHNIVDTLNTEIFEKGIYLENLGIQIPWELDWDNINNYKASKILVSTKRRKVLVWDSVQILHGIVTNVHYEFSRPLMAKKGYKKISTINCPINFVDAKRLNLLFNRFSRNQENDESLISKNQMWVINGCIILISFNKKFGYLLSFQKSQ